MFLKPSTNLTRRRRARGFTLIELMLVVILVTVLATLASPIVVGQWREVLHGRQGAIQVAQMYAEARLRALARGSAVMVRWDRATGFRVEEAIEGATAAAARLQPTCADQPGLGCLSNDWTTDTRLVQEYDTVDSLSVEGTTGAGATMTKMNVCFTPLGRSYASVNGATVLTPLVSTPTFQVRRMEKIGGTFTATGQTRKVVILPNGMARLAL